MALTTALLPVVFAATCALVLYQPWASVNALPLSDFYPFGTEHGDKSLPRGDDASAELKLDHSLPFYGQPRNLITILADGRLELYTHKESETFATISPFGANIDTSVRGEVFYREAQDQETLERALSVAKLAFPEVLDYNPRSAFVATWKSVGAHGAHDEKTNTFQCVLVSDGDMTFAIFLYGDGLMKWAEADGIMAEMGFTDDHSDKFTTLESNTRDMLLLDILENTNIQGVWAFRVDADTVTSPMTSSRARREDIDQVGSTPDLLPDQVYASIALPRYNGTEGQQVEIIIEIEVEGSGSGDIRVFTQSGTAAGGVDYISISDVIVADASNMGQISVFIDLLSDGVFECEERFTVVIESSDTNVIFGRCVTTVTIIDIIIPTEGTDYIHFIGHGGSADGSLQAFPPRDGTFGPIFIPIGFPFGNRLHFYAYIAENGIISFTTRFGYYVPFILPSTFVGIRQTYIVAPFWSDIDLTRGGSITYEIYNREDLASIDELDFVSAFIEAREGVTFTGSWMMIVTWSQTLPDLFSDSAASTNSFQAIVITNGLSSYAIFTYQCGGLTWSGSTVFAVVGYNAFGAFLANHPLSGTVDIAERLPCSCAQLPWFNIIYALPSTAVTTNQVNRVLCYGRYFTDIQQDPQIGPRIQGFQLFIIQLFLPACPCSGFQARFDFRYRLYFFSFSFGEVTTCYVPRFLRFTPFYGFGPTRMCCYRTFFFFFFFFRGPLIRSQPHPFVSSMIRWHPDFFSSNLIASGEFDYRRACCQSVGGICSLYIARRPIATCRFYRPIWWFWFWGDPHIRTLDGFRYTFNGLGEYTLLSVNTTNVTFAAQGRTDLAANSSATQFTAFAFGHPDGTVVEVRRENNDYTVLLNGNDISANVSAVNDTVAIISDVTIERMDADTVLTVFDSEFTVRVRTLGQEIPDITVSLPRNASLEGETHGLLGNGNEDESDDLVYPNGTMLSVNASDRMIHDFGQSWQITDEESLFTYPSGLGVANFSDPNHEPPFADEISVDQDVIDMCGGDSECVFDATVTGDPEIGMTTLMVDGNNTDDFAVGENLPPEITGPDRYRVNVGEPSIYIFEVSDDNDDTASLMVSVVGGLPAGSMLLADPTSPGTYNFTWTLSQVESIAVSFFATDSMDAVSVLNPFIEICGCVNDGICSLDVPDPDTSPLVMACNCSEAWEGDLCQLDVDGCATLSCFPGVDCVDVPGPGVGANCSDCPIGFSGDGSICLNIDECAMNTSMCDQNCTDTYGSFICSCNPGYELINGTKCVDIDECLTVNPCAQICTNTIGSFLCDCDVGFFLDAGGLSCNATTSCGPNNCSEECAVVNGSQVCYCTTQGYQLDSDNITCVDIDECSQNHGCEDECVNLDPFFMCVCNDPGFVLSSDDRSCDDVDECSDVTQCDFLPLSLCLNTIGSFQCLCPEGTVLVNNSCQVVEVQFTQASYTVSEAVGFLEVCIQASGGQLAPSTVSVSTSDFTAMAGSDFLRVDGQQFTFDTLPSTLCLEICILNDDILEAQEEFDILITQEIVGGNIVINTPSAAVYIIDNSEVTVMFQQPSFAVTEDSRFVEVCMVATGSNLTRSVMVVLNTQAVSATAGDDYVSLLLEPVVFIETPSTMCARIEIVNDTLVEDSEEFQVSLATNDDAVNVMDADPATVTIIDSSVVSIGWQQPSYMVTEGDGVVTLCFSVTGQLARAISLTTTTIDITANAPGDYDAIVDSTVEGIYVGEGCRNITIIDDAIGEYPEEIFGVLLTTTDSAIELTRPFAYVTILDRPKDVFHVVFQQTSYQFSEAEGMVYVCVNISGIDSQPSPAIVIELSTMEDSAEAGDDYESALSISNHTMDGKACLRITLLPDGKVEYTEQFSVNLQVTVDSDLHSAYVPLSSVTVSIEDADTVTVEFQVTSFMIPEGAQLVGSYVCISLNGSLCRSVYVTLTTQSGTAIADIDFPQQVVKLAFYENVTEACGCIIVTDDSILEDDEVFFVTLGSTDPAVSFDATEAAAIQIIDDDASEVTVGFDQSHYIVLENASNVTVCVNLTGEISRNVQVQVSTEDGSAMAMVDYYPINCSALVFTPTSSQQCFDIQIIADNMLEADMRDFFVNLKTSESQLVLDPSRTTVYIIDDDVVSAMLVVHNLTLEEGATGEICVNLTQPPDSSITVIVTSVDGLAQNGSDYYGFSELLEFQPGETYKCVQFTILNDNAIEGSEDFEIVLTTTEPQNVYIIPGYASASVTIVDLTTVTLEYIPPNAVNEDATSGFVIACVIVDDSVTLENGESLTFTLETRSGLGECAAIRMYSVPSLWACLMCVQ